MNRRLISSATFLCAALIAVMVLMTAASTVFAGAPPDFRLQDLDGNWVALGDYVGDDVVYVTFWATWCVPCRREMPHLQALYEELGDRGLTIIGVNTDPPGTTSKIKPYIRRYNISYPTVLDPDNNVLDKYNPTRELPYAVLVDRSGNVEQIFPGYRAGDEKLLRDKVLALLDERPSDGTAAGAAD
ncbi:MAG: TlpA disulfide reductase family protein [Holophagae bacterium]|jgi:peroxiredoxin